MEEKIKLSELELDDDWKQALALAAKPTGTTVAEVAATINYSYTTTAQKLVIFTYKGWLVRRMRGSRAIYFLNRENIEV